MTARQVIAGVVLQGLAMKKLLMGTRAILGSRMLSPLSPQNGERHRAADAARDSGRWAEAAVLFRDLAAAEPSRQDLWVQAGNCFKEVGDCAAAFAAYSAVSDPSQRVEATLQLGHLFKVSGNGRAARLCYGWSAIQGDRIALVEARNMDNADQSGIRAALFADAVPVDVAALLARLERRGLHCVHLMNAAQALAAEGLPQQAAMLTDLALVVGGPVAERRGWFRGALQAGGGAEQVAALDARPGLPSAEAALAVVLDAMRDPAIAVTPEAETAQDWQVSQIALMPDGDDLLSGLAAPLRALRQALFAPSQDLPSVLADFCAVSNRPGAAFVSFPKAGAGLATMASRVVVNTCLVLGARLALTLRRCEGRPELLQALFFLPTQFATGASNDIADRLAIEITAETELERLAQDDALAQCMPGFLLPQHRDVEALNRAAAMGLTAPLELWLSHQPQPVFERDNGLLRSWSDRLKRAGEWDSALRWVNLSLSGAVIAPEMHMELGILSKTCGQFALAASHFIEAMNGDPELPGAPEELAIVARECFSAEAIAGLARDYPRFGEVAARLGFFDAPQLLADEVPGSIAMQASLAGKPALPDYGVEEFRLLQAGWLRKDCGDSDLPRLIGVVAVRARIVTRDIPVGMRVRLNGRTLDYVRPSSLPPGVGKKSLHYFNSWIDVSSLPQGVAKLQVYVELTSSGYVVHEQDVYVDVLKPGEAYPDSDAFTLLEGDAAGQDVEARVAMLPCSVRSSSRAAFDSDIRRILVMRLDQMGDVATSLAGVRRLKEIFPGRSIEAVVTPANAEMVRSTGLFDDVVTVDFVYDHSTRKRHLNHAAILPLRRRYKDRGIDLAIDLSPGGDSRSVLKLFNARYLAGFKPHAFPYLHFGVDVVSRDAVNGRENISHTAMILALVEAIGAAIAPAPDRFALGHDGADALASLGLKPRQYVVLHSGARLALKRWPLANYVELARQIQATTGMGLVFFSDDPVDAASRAALQDIGATVLEGRVDFAVFDAVIANARLFVGNDTGPKHLAATRGVFTVSVHMDQVNWNEWGQDGPGYIVSRRVPCCGCGIEDPVECGRTLACLTQITPAMMLAAVTRGLAEC